MSKIFVTTLAVGCIALVGCGKQDPSRETAPIQNAPAAVARPVEPSADFPFEVSLGDGNVFRAPEGCLYESSLDWSVMVGKDASRACDYDEEDGYSLSFVVVPRAADDSKAPTPAEKFVRDGDLEVALPNAMQRVPVTFTVTKVEPSFVWIRIDAKPGSAPGISKLGGTMKVAITEASMAPLRNSR